MTHARTATNNSPIQTHTNRSTVHLQSSEKDSITRDTGTLSRYTASAAHFRGDQLGLTAPDQQGQLRAGTFRTCPRDSTLDDEEEPR